MLFSVVVLAVLASAQGRAVNISNTWVLPEEGFPVFYRYFRDRISWYEADAVCQFHHANLVTVDTTAQYDAVRAYLKELDISNAVWVGLIRSNPDGDFTWTDYRGLSGDGYWSAAPDARSAPLCAAADPAADYRWEARACGGPTVASFICELPVPQWALGNEGCMVRALPALTILYLPESAAVQLTADCGMAGVKKVQCTGNVKREDLLKELSCAVGDELTTGSISTGSNWPASTDTAFTDQDITNDVTTDETITTEHEVDINQPREVTATSLPRFIYSQTQYKMATNADNTNKLNSLLAKHINFDEEHDNNLHSNFIPKTVSEDNVLTNDELEKLEDERHKQHKMLHEEIARVGNVDNIFTQPTDHFIPPLVMAKAKISEDMTVLSLAEKHAQQLAEKQFSKQTLNNGAIDHYYSDNHSSSSKFEDSDKPLIATIKPTKFKDSKQEILKHHTPKKYMNDKYNDAKSKTFKFVDNKLADKQNLTPIPPVASTETATKNIEQATSTQKLTAFNMHKKGYYDDDLGMDLKVIINDAPLTSEEQPSFSGDVPKLETIKNINMNKEETTTQAIVTTSNYKNTELSTAKLSMTENAAMQHDVIKITVITDDDKINNTTVFDVTTNMPVFKDSVTSMSTSAPFLTTHKDEILSTESHTTITVESPAITTTTPKIITTEFREETTTPVTHLTSTVSTSTQTENITTVHPIFTNTEIKSSTEIATTEKAKIEITSTQEPKTTHTATTLPTTIGSKTININNTNLNETNISNEATEKIELNSSEYHDMLLNMTDHRQNGEENSTETDFQSPLLSGVMEPMHRPPRTRRPQQPPRNKFNPFRILG